MGFSPLVSCLAYVQMGNGSVWSSMLFVVLEDIIKNKVNYIDTLMFDETRLATPYFQQMTLRSRIFKIIHTPLHFWSGLWIILG